MALSDWGTSNFIFFFFCLKLMKQKQEKSNKVNLNHQVTVFQQKSNFDNKMPKSCYFKSG